LYPALASACSGSSGSQKALPVGGFFVTLSIGDFDDECLELAPLRGVERRHEALLAERCEATIPRDAAGTDLATGFSVQRRIRLCRFGGEERLDGERLRRLPAALGRSLSGGAKLGFAE
jgi:hypothetical protein